MSSSSATGASSRSPSPATPDASDNLQHIVVEDEDYPWLASSPIGPRLTSWDGKPTPHVDEARSVPALSLQDLIHDSAFEESISPTDSVNSRQHVWPDGLALTHQYQFGPSLQELLLASQHTSTVIPTTEPSSQAVVEANSAQHPVVCPPKAICQNLPIIMPNIPQGGTKSRVETQIRMVFDLASAEPLSGGGPYNRVGSWRWLKLPKGTSTKKRARKAAKIAPAPSDILKLSVDVSCASPPFTPVISCSTCQAREAKRLARKIAARVRPPRSDSDDGMDEDDNTGKGEDTSSIVQFNCPELLDFSTGSAILPLRVTCYCRHHREKVGFRVTFTLHDDLGRVVGTGTTAPIMITDDHKTGAASRKKNTDGSGATSPGGRKDTSGSSKVRAKPYDFSRPTSQKQSVNASPCSSNLSLPDTRAPTPAEFTQSALWTQAMGLPTAVPWNTSDGHSSILDPLFNSNFDLGLPEPLLQESQATPTSPSQTSLANTVNSMAMPLSFFPTNGSTSFLIVPTPAIHRIVPGKGPTCGGTEVTILGSNFQASTDIKCMFGDVVATSTQRWSENTLVCIVPPRMTPGVVPVWIEGHPVIEGTAVPHFTYEDESDRALMELALQVLGLKLTGKVEDAKNVALRIVGNTAVPETSGGMNASNLMQTLSSGGTQFQDSVMKILSLLDVTVPGASSLRVADVISLQTSGGQSLLHLSVILGFTVVADFLLVHGVDVDLRDKNGYTALHFAALTRSATGARKLVAAGADVEIVDARGRTARDVGPPHFFRSIHVGFSNPSSTSALSDDEAELGDNEDDSDSEPRIRVHKRRMSRRKPSTTLRERPTLESDQDTVVPPSSPPPVELDVKEEPSPVDEKRPTVTYAELLQRTISQLSKENLPNVPQMLVPFMPYLPGMPNVPWVQLPHIPVFPILVPSAAWPAFLEKRTPSSENVGEEADGGNRPSITSVAGAMRTAQDWLAAWEKLRTISTSGPSYVQEEEASPPPVYTPRVSSEAPQTLASTAPASPEPVALATPLPDSEDRVPARPQYPPVSTSTDITAAYEYRPTSKQVNKMVHKQDRMLFFFWLPMLFAGFIWACFTAVGVALQGARTMVEMKTGIRL